MTEESQVYKKTTQHDTDAIPTTLTVPDIPNSKDFLNRHSQLKKDMSPKLPGINRHALFISFEDKPEDDVLIQIKAKPIKVLESPSRNLNSSFRISNTQNSSDQQTTERVILIKEESQEESEQSMQILDDEDEPNMLYKQPSADFRAGKEIFDADQVQALQKLQLQTSRQRKRRLNKKHSLSDSKLETAQHFKASYELFKNIHSQNLKVLVRDGFNIPVRDSTLQKQGPCLVKTPQGFFKQQYLILKNQELYIYSNSESRVENDMIVLQPNLFIQTLHEKRVDNQYHQNDEKLIIKKVFPIKIFTGGEIRNQGVSS